MNRVNVRALTATVTAIVVAALPATAWASPTVRRVPAASAPMDGAHALWSDTIHRLETEAPPRDLFSGPPLYVVQLVDGLEPAEVLAGLEILVLEPPTASEHGVALVHSGDHSGDPARVDRLAIDIHRATGSCGALQRLEEPDLPPGQAPSLAGLEAIHSEEEALTEVRDLIAAVSPAAIAETIATLEDQGTRFHGSASGQATPELIATLACQASRQDPCPLELDYVTHGATLQQSLVISLPGAVDDDTAIVVGAHLDSINNGGGTAPGADDDASGVAAVVEVLRVLLSGDAQLERRVELHFYAAEEIGLVGSDAIAASYARDGRSVHAMLQCDMNGYAEGGSHTIHLVTNDTSAELNDSLASLMDTYLGGDYRRSVLTLGTSDHRSWSRRGFAAAFPTEDPNGFNPHIHTSSDTADRLDADRSARYTSLAVAFVAHHAGLLVEEPEPVILDDDLKVAIVRSPTQPTLYDLLVATPANIERVRVCETDAADGLACTGSSTELLLSEQRSGRRFFASSDASPLPFEAGDALLLEGLGFDEQGATRLLQRRSLTLGTP